MLGEGTIHRWPAGSLLSFPFFFVATRQEIEKLLNSRRFAYFVPDFPAFVGFSAHIRRRGLVFLGAPRGSALSSPCLLIRRYGCRRWNLAVEVHAFNELEISLGWLKPG